MRPGSRAQRLAPVTTGSYSPLQVCPPKELEPFSRADFPARLLQLLWPRHGGTIVVAGGVDV
ncbi:uncharacterized protein TrAtP1_001041 [Trichoderma atroviride]|uniref:uncharacterized protein n=1 Tax=Hypocrea atroviridis TaxID=63577 RepID=UPI00331EFC5C|nr:hypothetical protein TrAtP1_001041 [Trichoderma atroviride]